MPIMNDNESRLSTKEDTDGCNTVEGISESLVPIPWHDIELSPDTAACAACGQTLQAHGYRGVHGWSHVEKKGCVPSEEDWSDWSLRLSGCFGNASPGSPGPSVSYGTGPTSGRALLRQQGPVAKAELLFLESGGPCVWIWQAMDKAIFLQSDGYLRVNGKGSVIANATAPVFLDFGPGFQAKVEGGFESRVAHVLDKRLLNDRLYLKVRWISHLDLVKELNECPDKFYGSPERCPEETKSLVPVEPTGLVPLP